MFAETSQHWLDGDALVDGLVDGGADCAKALPMPAISTAAVRMVDEDFIEISLSLLMSVGAGARQQTSTTISLGCSENLAAHNASASLLHYFHAAIMIPSQILCSVPILEFGTAETTAAKSGSGRKTSREETVTLRSHTFSTFRQFQPIVPCANGANITATAVFDICGRATPATTGLKRWFVIQWHHEVPLMLWLIEQAGLGLLSKHLVQKNNAAGWGLPHFCFGRFFPFTERTRCSWLALMAQTHPWPAVQSQAFAGRLRVGLRSVD
jgi:hypothetical protein